MSALRRVRRTLHRRCEKRGRGIHHMVTILTTFLGSETYSGTCPTKQNTHVRFNCVPLRSNHDVF